MISAIPGMEVRARRAATRITMCFGCTRLIGFLICRGERPGNNWMLRSTATSYPRARSSDSTSGWINSSDWDSLATILDQSCTRSAKIAASRSTLRRRS